MGIAALVLGIICFFASWIPIIGTLAIFPAGIGFILGLVDVIIKAKKKEKKAISIAGLVISIVAIIISIGMTILVGFIAWEDFRYNTSGNWFYNDYNYHYNYEDNRLNNINITVDKVEKSQGDENNKPKSGKEYVIVYLTIRNNGIDNLEYDTYNFKMQNSHGQQSRVVKNDIDYNTKLSYGELIPRGVVSGTLVFEEDINDNNLTLIYEHEYLPNQSIKISI